MKTKNLKKMYENDPNELREERIIEKTKKAMKKNVTSKTLKSWTEQCERIIEQELVNKEEAEALKKIKESVKTNFIKTIF